ncbi:malto-oligosyltrehalose synthase [Devosia sp.]|uniref:malto-oligosyltrehalose synthase n=1 Tax=Devosia sp. TaxID=1871048 RepID=UPI003A925481
MTTPTATYRVQFRNGMGFAEALRLVPYIKALGASHFYASPIYVATPGSTHGYDVTDHNHFDPELGGDTGFAELSAALKAAGLGLMLDIVPNHMAADFANAWWHSVVEWGADSPYARHFDIDWREPLTLPFLGQPFADCLAAGELSFGFDTERGVLGLKYYETIVPLHPSSYGMVLGEVTHPASREIASRAEAAQPGGADAFHAGILATLTGDTRETLEAAVAERAKTPGLLAAVHEAQRWRLNYWREARSHLSYRRFFEVTGLAGVRVEDLAVFEDVHRKTLDLVADGTLDALRIDHVDGLADPGGYLKQLRSRIGDTWLVVEKILESSETLPEDWAIEGTTGYEFIDALAGVLVDQRQADAFEDCYSASIKTRVDLDAERRQAKQQMLAVNFETEMTGLTDRAAALADLEQLALTAPDLRSAMAALITAFPVYRTYGNAEGQSQADQALLAEIAADATEQLPDCAEAIGFIVSLLKLEVSVSAKGAALDFTVRFQQLSGPIMAKALEDTLFYRRNRLLALNEVGGDPQSFGRPLSSFHDTMAARVTAQPEGLLATSTHDTKRGEDARARLYALSEAPALWAERVARWREMNAGLVKDFAGAPTPSAELEWLVYQALAGIWPLDSAAEISAILDDLRPRFLPYLTKVVREAKQFTNWVDIDEGYEEIIDAFGAGLFDAQNAAFFADFAEALQPFMRAGALNSLTQTVLKLTAPGIPDIYQGTEGWDFSLVDPDNRRPVDFDSHARNLAAIPDMPMSALVEGWHDGRIKQALLHRGLAARSEYPQLFTHGQYHPLEVTGDRSQHVIAFARRQGSGSAMIIAPRWTFDLLKEGDGLSIPAGQWGDTAVMLPDESGALRNVFADGEVRWQGRVPVADLLADVPVALLMSR